MQRLRNIILPLLILCIFLCPFARKLNAQPVPWGVSDSLQAILDDFITDNNIQGGIMSVHSRDGNWTWKGQAGIANISTMQQADTSMFYRIGSISKNIMAVSILHLVDNAVLSLHDTIGQWLDSTLTNKIPYSEQITLKHLLNHTSGIFSYTDDASFMTALLSNPHATFTPDSLISIALSHPPVFLPGDSMKYNNTGYVILTKIIESACSISYHQYATQNIFNTNGLSSTYFPDTNIIAQDHMKCYADFDFNLILEDYTNVSPTFAIGAGEVISTLDNQIHYFNTLIDGNILSQNSYNELLTPFPGSDYSLGTQVIPGLIMGHGGNYFNTSGLWYYEALDVIIAFNFNYNNVNYNDGILIPVYLLLSKPDLSVESLKTDEQFLHLYPNPAYDSFIVETADTDGIAIINDMLGREILRIPLTQTQTRIETANWHKGLYILTVISKEGVSSGKVMVR